jgi:hypothetical protein
MTKTILFLLATMCLSANAQAAFAEFRFDTVTEVSERSISGVLSRYEIVQDITDGISRMHGYGSRPAKVSAVEIGGKALLTPQCSQLAAIALSSSVPTELLIEAVVPNGEKPEENSLSSLKVNIDKMKCTLVKRE